MIKEKIYPKPERAIFIEKFIENLTANEELLKKHIEIAIEKIDQGADMRPGGKKFKIAVINSAYQDVSGLKKTVIKDPEDYNLLDKNTRHDFFKKLLDLHNRTGKEAVAKNDNLKIKNSKNGKIMKKTSDVLKLAQEAKRAGYESVEGYEKFLQGYDE